jgi:hypothetical protein
LGKEHADEIKPKIENFLDQCRSHMQVAHTIHDTDEIAWLTKFFLGKVAEKQNEPLEVVLGNYQECLKFMSTDGISMIGKISTAAPQKNFEPVEALYRVHSFLEKRRDQAYKEKNVEELRRVCKGLQLFSSHIALGLTRQLRQDAPSFATTSVEEFLHGGDDEVSIRILLMLTTFQAEELLSLATYNEKAETSITNAFKAILVRFPHYKAAYSLAKQMVSDDYKGVVDLFFPNIFSIKGGIGKKTNIFKVTVLFGFNSIV